jgi:glycosyltransferase involved in cell wall biosynthesis
VKRILIISNMYPSKKYPHYGVFVENTKNILSANGYKCRVIAITKKDRLFQKILGYLCFYLSSLAFIVFGKYDYVYAHYASHTALPLLVARKFNKRSKYILNVHGNDVVPESGSDERYIKYVNQLLPECEKIICPSEYFKKIMISKYSVSANKLIVYPSGGVDLRVFRRMDRNQCIEKLGLQKGCKYIGYISRIEEKKGWELFIRAASELLKTEHDLKFIVVGGGSQEYAFFSEIERLGISNSVVKYDLLPQNQIAKIYNILDVFVFPTYRKSESLGLVGLEALACGTIVVASDSYGPSSYMSNNVNGFTFKTADLNSLTDTIRKALSIDNKEKERIVKFARKSSEQYSNQNTSALLLEVFK